MSKKATPAKPTTSSSEPIRHSYASIVQDTLAKISMSRSGGALFLVPKVPDEDFVLVIKETGVIISMYKKPTMPKDWKITDSFIPVLLPEKNVLVDRPTDIVVADQNMILTYQDGTTVRVGISKTISTEIETTTLQALRSIPDTIASTIEVTDLMKNTQTESIAAHDGTVLVGNNYVAVRYKSKGTTDIIIKNKYLLENVRMMARQSKSEIGLAISGRNAIIANYTGEIKNKVNEALVHVIMHNYEAADQKSPSDTIKNSSAAMDRKDSVALVSSNKGVFGLLQAMKSVMTKYSGQSDNLSITVTEGSIIVSIKDAKTEINNKISDTFDVDKKAKLPVPIIVPIPIARYLMDMKDQLEKLAVAEQGTARIILWQTPSETAIFKG
jgi:hypothetical protein